MARSKTPGEMVAITLRIKIEVLEKYRDLAARVTVQQGGKRTFTAQDLMRDCLEYNPALTAENAADRQRKG